MPIHTCTLPGGRTGYKWGHTGKCYADRKDAERQAEAIYANGYSGDCVAQDATARTYDKDGRLHISRSHISKSNINPYYGREVPGSKALGLDPDKIYYFYRAPEELAKAAPTFARLPILKRHVPISANAPRQDLIVGAIGSEVEFLDPYLDADTCIWDAAAIAGIETDKIREFSCSYHWVPVMTTGEFDGQHYDGIMTQIQGNHLALVESGRAGNDVLAADQLTETDQMNRTKLGNALAVALTTAFPKVKIAADSALAKMLDSAKRKTFDVPGAVKLVLAMDAEMKEKEPEVKAVMDALVDIDDPKPTKRDNEYEEPAGDEGDDDEDMHKDGCDCAECKKAAKDKRAKDKKAAADKKAKDEKEEREKETKSAMDSMEKNLRASLKAAEEAKEEVRPVVGKVVAMDSAEEIYGFALDQMKVDRTGVTGAPALRAMFKLAREKSATKPAVAMDSAAATAATTKFPGLSRFK